MGIKLIPETSYVPNANDVVMKFPEWFYCAT